MKVLAWCSFSFCSTSWYKAIMVSNRVLFSIICELLWLIEYKLFTNITNIQIFNCKTAKSNFALQKIEYSRIVTNNWNSINGEWELLYCVFWRPLAVFIRRGMVCSFSATPCTYRKIYRCTNKQSDGLIINRSVYNPQQPPISRRHIAARNLQSLQSPFLFLTICFLIDQ